MCAPFELQQHHFPPPPPSPSLSPPPDNINSPQTRAHPWCVRPAAQTTASVGAPARAWAKLTGASTSSCHSRKTSIWSTLT
eukprot:COSAG02_NODE_784_length_17232_cov_12.871651_2_plen_81_part_00